jgi:hypothetical protein
MLRTSLRTFALLAALGISAAAASACVGFESSFAADSYPGVSPEAGALAADAGAFLGYDAAADAAPGFISLCAAEAPGACDPDVGEQHQLAGACANMASPGDAGATIDAGAPAPDAGSLPPPADLACRVASQKGSLSAVCGAAGRGKDGDACAAGADCAAGFECVSSPGRCRHYCCDASLCKTLSQGSSTTGNAFCDVQAESSSSAVKVPVCLPVKPCKLLGDTCGVGQSCGIVDPSAGVTSCVDTGPAKVGERCDVLHCGAGLVCLGSDGMRACQQLCSPQDPHKSPCPQGQSCKQPWAVLKSDNAGLCQ